MKMIELEISLVADEPQDIMVQRDLEEILEMLESQGAKRASIYDSGMTHGIPKSAEVDLAIGAVHLVLPASLLASVIVSFIKAYFGLKRQRKVRIKKKDGTTIELSAYSQEETKDLIKILLGTKDKGVKRTNKTT